MGIQVTSSYRVPVRIMNSGCEPVFVHSVLGIKAGGLPYRVLQAAKVFIPSSEGDSPVGTRIYVRISL